MSMSFSWIITKHDITESEYIFFIFLKLYPRNLGILGLWLKFMRATMAKSGENLWCGKHKDNVDVDGIWMLKYKFMCISNKTEN